MGILLRLAFAVIPKSSQAISSSMKILKSLRSYSEENTELDIILNAGMLSVTFM